MGNRPAKNGNNVNQDDLAFLKKNTKFDEETLGNFHTGFLQDSIHGKMSKEEFSKKFQGAFCSGRNKEEFSAHIFQALDTDKNGYIDFRKIFKTK